MLRLLAVIDRDLKKFRRNPVTLAMSVLMPIIYLVILGNSFQGKLQALPLIVLNQDSGPHSRSIMESLRAIEAGPKTFEVLTTKNQKDAIDGVRAGRYKAALIIPSDYSKKVALKSRPNVGLFLDNTDGISSEAIRNAVAGALKSINADYVSIRERTDEIFLRDSNLYKKVDYFQSLVPGVVIMAIFLGTLTTGAFNLVMDRFLGVDESYLLTPLSKWDIVGGLIISGLFITTIIATLILVVSMIMTGIPFPKSIGQFVSILVVIVLTTLSLLSLMFVILGRFNHPRIVGILSGFLNVILFFPSGAIYPIASFPPWLKTFAKINPEAYAVDALKALLFKGVDMGSIFTDILFLLVFTGVMMTLAVVTFKRTL
ncbi:MAG: ABC transporter permease [Desulfobacteraceae bacterium]|nr:MAG: ABC transporter permease [Desulfobacteraceae bacterium]